MSAGPPESFGPYVVYEQLGIGGMAQVHRAEQAGIEGFKKVVALKRMLPHVAANHDMVQAFVREARLASYLRHENVAQTYELGKVGDIYFIAMELIEGRNLREVLRACGAIGKLMPVPVALNIINQICDALDYAHNLTDDSGQRLGIIHRDVSPSNIIVAEGGVVKLIDFGIAKASAAGMQTMSGLIKGKFGYMAPEYIAGSIDARADLFAVGVIAHELLTNRSLFTSKDDMDTLQRVQKMTIEPPSRKNPNVPHEIDEIIMTALERNPDARWQHATALRNAMTTVTKRLGLSISNQQLAEWLDRTFFDVPTVPVASSAYPTDDGYSVSISVENATSVSLASSQKVTLGLRGPALAPMHLTPTPVPAGTPGGAINAQPSPRTESDHLERHDALVPSGSFLADEVVPTMVRPSTPRVEVPSVPERRSAPGVHQPAPAESDAMPVIAAGTGGGRLLAVLLVLLAAAAAATAVYFLLPLLTT